MCAICFVHAVVQFQASFPVSDEILHKLTNNSVSVYTKPLRFRVAFNGRKINKYAQYICKCFEINANIKDNANIMYYHIHHLSLAC